MKLSRIMCRIETEALLVQVYGFVPWWWLREWFKWTVRHEDTEENRWE